MSSRAWRPALFVLGALIGGGGCATSEDVGPGAATGGAAGNASGGASTTGGGGASSACVPGVQIACACPGGVEGAQACKPDGSGYDPCMCPDGGAGGAGGSGGSGGTSTGGSGGSGGTSASGGAGGTSGAGGSSAGGGAGGTSTGGGGIGAGGGSGGTSGAGAGGTGGATNNQDACPGTLLQLTAPLTTIQGTLVGFSNDSSGGGKCSPSGNGNDVVYRIVPAWTGTLTAKLTPSGFSSSVYHSAGSCLGNSPAKCAYSVTIGQAVSLSFSVTAGATYYLFIDSYTTSVSGTFALELSSN